jgi:3-hydroxyacyl-CoA dehydrogenase/enoyl-CoA hydratase/3-hydroxybutyryl-CoA epimerase
VIEAVVENMDIKKSVFKELDKNTSPNTILATNTSALSVTEMARVVKDPSRVVGMHFFNPVHRMPLVEIIKGEKTSDEAIETIVQFSRNLRKTPIVVKDACGFLVNRLLLPYLNEAGFLAEEGVNFEKIDKALLDFGTPMGAFILLDEIGLDVAYKVAQVLHQAFGDRMTPVSILKTVYESKLLGRKSGEGFYLHQGKTRKVNPKISGLLKKSGKSMSDEDIVMRCLSVMINEAAHCLEEGICREPADVDIGMIMGTGFPPFRGGLLRYADDLGIDRVVQALEKYSKEVDSKRFEPAKMLLTMRDQKQSFYARIPTPSSNL